MNIIPGHMSYWVIGGGHRCLAELPWLIANRSGRGQYFQALAKIKKAVRSVTKVSSYFISLSPIWLTKAFL